MKKQDRKLARDTVLERALTEQLEECQQTNTLLDVYINRVLQAEFERINAEGMSVKNRRDYHFWKGIQRKFENGTLTNPQQELAAINERYLNEIMGRFDERLFWVASKLVPLLVQPLLRRISLRGGLISPDHHTPTERFVISGPVDHIQHLAEKGTLVFLPTHVSHLDSIILGWGLHLKNLPSVMYGAGLNLFTNRILGYLMNGLGAYKVDRQKQNDAYKSVLKNFVAFALQHGYHNLFYPGGTRARSGAIESKLKLGLLGSALSAFQYDQLDGDSEKAYYVVPCTVNYNLTLEANSLIKEKLFIDGAGRFIHWRESIPRWVRWIRGFNNLRRLNAQIHLRFGEPLDLFGNQVDEQGNSIDPQGHAVDPASYLKCHGETVKDHQRNQVYTGFLGEQVLKQLRNNNVTMATHLACFVMFQMVRKQMRNEDIFEFLSVADGRRFVVEADLVKQLERLLPVLKDKAAKGELVLNLPSDNADEIFNSALDQFTGYHGQRVMRRKQGKVYSDCYRLVYYYHNKLTSYELEQYFD